MIIYQCYCNNVFRTEEDRDACTHNKDMPDLSKCPFCGRDWPEQKESA